MDDPAPGTRVRAPGPLPFQRATASAHCHATEIPARVEEALRALVGPAPIHETRARGHHGNPIRVLEARLEGGDLRRAMETLRSAAGPWLARELDARVADDLWFYARLDKQRASQGALVVANVDDPIRLRAKVKVFPASKAEALEALRAFFDA